MATTLNDPLPMMKQLAEMAGVPSGLYRRMVLVLDIDDVPRLYCEQYLGQDKTLPFVNTRLEFEEKAVTVKTEGGLSCE